MLSEIDRSPIRRRDMSGSPDDNMDDLSPETQELMRKVMGKGSSLASLGTAPVEKPEYPSANPQRSQQLLKMMTMSKQN